MEVVSCLCEDACPVDGVDSSKVEGFVDFGVCKEGFDCILQDVSIVYSRGSGGSHLAIIKCALNSQIVYIRIQDRCHLCFLYGTDSALRM